jgi:hypothetical protein
MRLVFSLAVVCSLMAAVPLPAQARGRPADTVPSAQRPPPGMCRIWLVNVPAGKQAAPTDCATAVRNRPANGFVVFGDSAAKAIPPVGRPVQQRPPAPPPTKTKVVVPPPTGKPPKPPPKSH